MAFRLREALRYPDSRTVSVTISREADKWYASVVCEAGEPQTSAPLPESPRVVGVDVGVREYVTSNGSRYLTPRPLRNAQRRLRRAGKALSRKRKGSKNRSLGRERLARLHARVAHTRTDFLHKMTSAIVGDCDVAVIEDLNVKGMTRNRRLAKSIADASFGEFRREMTYKTAERGRRLIVADRFYPSSKLCSACGAKAKRMPLSIRDWTCGECGTHHDRDVNAAINLREFGLSVLLGKPTVYADSSAVSACGEFCVSAGEDTFSPCPASVLCEAGTKQRTYR
jgi:putative transposase